MTVADAKVGGDAPVHIPKTFTVCVQKWPVYSRSPRREVECTASMSLTDLRETIATIAKLPSGQIRLSVAEQKLTSDSASLARLGVVEGSHLMLRLGDF